MSRQRSCQSSGPHSLVSRSKGCRECASRLTRGSPQSAGQSYGSVRSGRHRGRRNAAAGEEPPWVRAQPALFMAEVPHLRSAWRPLAVVTLGRIPLLWAPFCAGWLVSPIPDPLHLRASSSALSRASRGTAGAKNLVRSALLLLPCGLFLGRVRVAGVLRSCWVVGCGAKRSTQ